MPDLSRQLVALNPVLQYLLQNVPGMLSAPFSSSSRFGWMYWLSFVVVAALVYRRTYAPDRSWRFREFLAFCFPKRFYLHPSALVDYKVWLINALMAPTGIVLSNLTVVALGGWVTASLVDLCGPSPARFAWTGWTALVYACGLMVAREFGMFISHAVQHEIPFLWEFHKVHHSAEVLTPITSERKHPLMMMFTSLTLVVTISLYQGASVYLFIERVDLGTLLRIGLFTSAFELAFAHLRHSHIWLSYGRVLEHVLISPAQHQIHHSNAPRHWNKNYGETFAFFDWLYGTLYVPKGREQLSFGLPEGTQEHPSLTRAYVVPFVNVWRSLRAPDVIRAE